MTISRLQMELAGRIISYFNPTGGLLEPGAGDGYFLRHLQSCLDEGPASDCQKKIVLGSGLVETPKSVPQSCFQLGAIHYEKAGDRLTLPIPGGGFDALSL